MSRRCEDRYRVATGTTASRLDTRAPLYRLYQSSAYLATPRHRFFRFVWKRFAEPPRRRRFREPPLNQESPRVHVNRWTVMVAPESPWLRPLQNSWSATGVLRLQVREGRSPIRQ